MFYSPRVKSQFFSEPVPLDSELHMCVFVFFFAYVGRDGSNGLELGISLPQVRLC